MDGPRTDRVSAVISSPVSGRVRDVAPGVSGVDLARARMPARSVGWAVGSDFLPHRQCRLPSAGATGCGPGRGRTSCRPRYQSNVFRVRTEPQQSAALPEIVSVAPHVAALVFLVAAWLLLGVIIHIVSFLFGIAVLVLAVVAVVWALRILL